MKSSVIDSLGRNKLPMPVWSLLSSPVKLLSSPGMFPCRVASKFEVAGSRTSELNQRGEVEVGEPPRNRKRIRYEARGLSKNSVFKFK